MPTSAPIRTRVSLNTLWVLIVKLLVFAPAGIVTALGTAATFGFSDRSVTVSAAEADELSVTTPVELFPPETLAGERVSETIAGRGGGE